nr:MAG TPA: CLLAC-motif containing domain protein [Caudoviricetes sp.]
MFQIIIGCVLANILTIAIIGLSLYLVYLDILP